MSSSQSWTYTYHLQREPDRTVCRYVLEHAGERYVFTHVILSASDLVPETAAEIHGYFEHYQHCIEQGLVASAG